MDARLSIWTSYYFHQTFEEAVEELIKNGVYCAELSDEHGLELLKRSDDPVETGKKVAQFIKERNFEMPQGHLWLKIKICTDEASLSALYSWIDLYEAIGIKNMVLHCDIMSGSGLSKKEVQEANIEKLKILAEKIKDRDITICLENLRSRGDDGEYAFGTAEDLLAVIEGVGSDRFGICLDTGHLNMVSGNAHREFILKAGKRLHALHIADNQGETDQHLMPFNCGTVNFFDVVSALKEIDYDGIFNYEIPGERSIPFPLLGEKIKFIKAGYEILMNNK